MAGLKDLVERETRVFPIPKLLIATHHRDMPYMPAGQPCAYRATDHVYCDNHYITHDGELVTVQHVGGGQVGMRSPGIGEWTYMPKVEAHDRVAWSLVGPRLDGDFLAAVLRMGGL